MTGLRVPLQFDAVQPSRSQGAQTRAGAERVAFAADHQQGQLGADARQRRAQGDFHQPGERLEPPLLGTAHEIVRCNNIGVRRPVVEGRLQDLQGLGEPPSRTQRYSSN